MRKNEIKEERAGRVESFPPRKFIREQKVPLITMHQELIYCPSQRKITKKKKTKPKAITGDKMRRKPKRGTKVKNSNRQQEQCRRVEK